MRLKKKRPQKVKTAQGSLIPMMLLAFFIGYLSMFAGRAAAYQFFADGGLMPIQVPVEALQPYLPYAGFAFAAVLALMFAWTFRLGGVLKLAALVGGLVVAVQYETQVMSRIPSVYAAFYSKPYVIQALTGQKPA